MQLLFHFMARLRAIVRPETAIDPQASAAHPRHFAGQKLRLGGDALGADPTYLLYLAYRSRGELRRIDLGPGCAGATWSYFAAPESARKPLLHTRGISRARSFDLEVTPWAPTRLTSCISHTGPEESSGASTLPRGPHSHLPPQILPRIGPQAAAAHPRHFPGQTRPNSWRV